MKQAGFSAVELLITLFIAAIFLLAGYQLWGYVQRAGAEADQLAKASNIAYDYLRREANKPITTCSSSTPVNNVSVPAGEMGDLPANTTITVVVSCPAGLNNIKRVQSTVRYGSEPKEVVHAIYAS